MEYLYVEQTTDEKIRNLFQDPPRADGRRVGAAFRQCDVVARPQGARDGLADVGRGL